MILASIPSPPAGWSAVTVGIFTFRATAFLILLGIVVAAIVTSRRLTARGTQPGVVLDVAICVIPLGLIGARLWYVLTHLGTYFTAGADPLAVLQIWDGGTAVFGAIAGGLVGLVIASRWTGIRLTTLADAAAPGVLLAQGIGRIGDWLAVQNFGLPTTAPWGLAVPSSNAAFPAGLQAGTLFQPTFLYELVWDVAGVALILLIDHRSRLRWGRAFALYLMWYGLGRAVIETIRIDQTTVLLGLRANTWAGIVAVIAGIALAVVSRRRHPGIEPGAYLPGREWVADAPVVSRYTAADFEVESGAGQVAEPATSGGAPR